MILYHSFSLNNILYHAVSAELQFFQELCSLNVSPVDIDLTLLDLMLSSREDDFTSSFSCTIDRLLMNHDTNCQKKSVLSSLFVMKVSC